MFLTILAIVFALTILFALILFGWFARSLNSDIPEDVAPGSGHRKHVRRPRSIFSRFWSWLNKSPPLLDYRRDKKGRFRKVRRG